MSFCFYSPSLLHPTFSPLPLILLAFAESGDKCVREGVKMKSRSDGFEVIEMNVVASMCQSGTCQNGLVENRPGSWTRGKVLVGRW